MKNRKIIIRLLLLIVLVFLSVTTIFAYGGYGTPSNNIEQEYFTWMVWDDIPRWVGAYCSSNLTQYAMIAGQYIGFHEAYLFSKADPTSIFDTYYVLGGYSVNYYKGSSGLGSSSLSTCSDLVLVDPDWVWFYKDGNANGLLGSGSGTYYAKATTSFGVDGAISYKTITNSVPFTIN